MAGPEAKPGFFAVGGWRQTGELSTDSGITEDGATGLYVYGSQLIWFKDAEPINNAGISAFFSLAGITRRPIFDTYVGAGLTFRSLIPNRPQDSFGVGVAWGRLNPNIFENDGEFITQAYYQAQVSGSIYTETALSYIPKPGAEPDLPAALAVTQQLIVPF
ncbi:MAG: carbohydrate porin [Hyphomicrobiales bacterium]